MLQSFVTVGCSGCVCFSHGGTDWTRNVFAVLEGLKVKIYKNENAYLQSSEFPSMFKSMFELDITDADITLWPLQDGNENSQNRLDTHNSLFEHFYYQIITPNSNEKPLFLYCTVQNERMAWINAIRRHIRTNITFEKSSTKKQLSGDLSVSSSESSTSSSSSKGRKSSTARADSFPSPRLFESQTPRPRFGIEKSQSFIARERLQGVPKLSLSSQSTIYN